MAEPEAHTQPYPPGRHPDLPPPAATGGIIGWARANLMSSPENTIVTLLTFAVVFFALNLIVGYGWSISVLVALLATVAVRIVARIVAGLPVLENTLLTLIALYVIYHLASLLLNFLIFDAIWSASGADDCRKAPDGACWGFITARFDQFMYGFYPSDLRWRVDATGVLMVLLVIPVLFGRGRLRTWTGMVFLFVFPVIAFFLLYGGILGLEEVTTNRWGGMMLTLVIAVTGIAASLPIGVLLALGRRSDMVVIRNLSIIFIEFWRGVPLITVLFMASVMFPLFTPEGVSFNQLLRALIGVMLFSAAYMAEVVRGGLQAIPKGQYEGASALGLGYWRSMRLIVLPQALTIVIPGIVNSFIALFKDTTLVLIIGLFDFLGMIQAGLQDADWAAVNVPYTGYIFAALVYWAFCFSMSRYSVWLEGQLSTGHRR